MIGNITAKGRPLKFAFLIKNNDKRGLLKAIELNSILWGGPYNPIIPIIKRKTKRWRPYSFRKTANDITIGYINAFDPDYLVSDFELPKCITDLGIEVIKSNDFIQKGRLEYGIGIGDVLSWVHEEHFKYVQKDPISVVIPKIPKKDRCFWASWFGKIPKQQHEILLNSDYKKILDLKTPIATNIKSILKQPVFYPRSLMQYKLIPERRGGHSDENILFYLDPSSFLDVVDFWNLRAVGRKVLPIPKTLGSDKFLMKLAKDFIEDSFWVSEHNSFPHCIDVIPSTSSEQDEVNKFIDSLGVVRNKDGERMISMHTSYPRIWDEWARDKDGVEPRDITFGSEKDDEIGIRQDNISLPVSVPEDFKPQFTGNPIFANEISYNIYGGLEKYAEAFPHPAGKILIREIGETGGYKDWRIGKNGLVKLIDSSYKPHWSLPVAEKIFKAWLEDNGWKLEMSSTGKLTKELFKQINGWSHGLADKDLINLLEEMSGGTNGEGKDKKVGDIKDRMKQMFGNEDRLEKFIELEIFTLGIKAQCPNCQRNSWYELEKLARQLDCPKCLSPFKAIDSLSKSHWSYKTVGPLSVSNHSDGAICVVLSVELFSHRNMSSVQITPIYSFNASNPKSGRLLEADFAFLWRDTAFGDTSEGVAFGESKSFNEFKRADFKRMRLLAKDFPGAVIIFSTFREELTKNELKELKKFTAFGNKIWKNDRPINPALILTGKELFSFDRPPYCWDEAEQKQYRDIYGILDLAKATQQKYLGIKGWDTTWYEESVKKRERKASEHK